jgi:F-type H+-transporting ATPase subunit delta
VTEPSNPNSPNSVAAAERTVLEPGLQRLAEEYATALFTVAKQSHQTEEVLRALEELLVALRRIPELGLAFADPAVNRDHRERAIVRMLEHRVSPLLVDFMLLVNRNDRLHLLEPIILAYRRYYEEQSQHVRVKVRSAVPLTDDQQARLRKELLDTLTPRPLEIILEPQLDPTLLGGLIVQVGDRIYDSSVRTRLESIRRKLLERSSNEIQRQRNRVGAD